MASPFGVVVVAAAVVEGPGWAELVSVLGVSVLGVSVLGVARAAWNWARRSF